MNPKSISIFGALCLAAWTSSAASAVDPDTVSPSEQQIADGFKKLTPPKTNAYKHRRESWAALSNKHGRAVYRRKGEVLLKLTAPETSVAHLVFDADLQTHNTRFTALDADTQFVEFDERSVGIDAFAAKLRAKSGVAHVEANTISHVQEVPDYRNKLWHLNKAPERKAIVERKKSGTAAAGTKTTVCTIDTGVDLDHEDLKANLVSGVNVISAPLLGEPADTEMDYNGHGTMVAGLIAALDNDLGVEGVNPHAALCAIKAFDKEGAGALSDILVGIEWAIANRVDVLNLSFGSYEYSVLLEDAIQRARANGIVVVASAGNDYANDTMYPAKYPGVLAVGSHDEGGWVSRFSNWGDGVSFFAPGNQMLTTSLSEYGDDRYTPFYGTSAAAAYVSGLVSLLRDQGYSVAQVESALNANVILTANESNPTDASFKVINTGAILADTQRTPLEAETVSKFMIGATVVAPTGALELDVAVQNTGTRPAKPTTLKLKVARGDNESWIALGKLPAIPRGESVEKHYSVPVKQLLDGTQIPADTVVGLHVTPVIGDVAEAEVANSQQVFVTHKTLEAVRVRALWVTPLDFTDAGASRTLYANIQNRGNVPLSGLAARAFSIPALHEGVPESPRTLIGSTQSIAPLAVGETRLVAIPIPDFVPPPHNVTFALELLRGNQVAKLHLQGYRYSDERGFVTPQYAQTVHRNVVDQAIKLLEKQGIYIPDLQNALYRGSPSSANEWPDACITNTTLCLSLKSFTSSGYWSDETLSELSSHAGGGIKYALIDGSHDADALDIAFGYTFEDVFDSHFWIVDDFDDDGLNSSGTNHHSALTKLRALVFGGNGSRLNYGAIAHYKAGYKRAAWWFMGHAAHLIGDISVPSHVANENSHGVYGATYHDWMDKGNFSKWNYLNAEQKGGFINVYQQPTEGDPLRFLAYTTAQVGNSFPWASTGLDSSASGYYGHNGNRVAGGDMPHYDTYMAGVFGTMESHPLAKWQVNKDEVWDHLWSECQLVDWVGAFEDRSDCKDRNGHKDYDNSDDGGNNDDGDMARIAETNYNYAIRATAGLIYWFAVETGQIARVEVNRSLPSILGLLLD